MIIGHILVATDFSDPAEDAVRQAAAWAKRTGAKVTLAHALAVPDLDPDEVEQPIPEHAELEQAVHDHLDRVAKSVLAGCDAKTAMVRTTNPAVGITDLAKEIGADLIVVATHGRTGVQRMLLGSVAERVVRLSACPVLTVRSPVAG